MYWVCDSVLRFLHQRDYYEDNFTLTLSTTIAGLTIQYTKDGTNPFYSSTAISGTAPITINIDPSDTNGRDLAPGFCVRAVAIRSDTALSKVITHTYLFINRVTELSPDNKKPGPGWLDQNTSGDGQQIHYGMDQHVYHNPLYIHKMISAMSDIPTFSLVLDLDDLFDPKTGLYVNAFEHGIEWIVQEYFPDRTGIVLDQIKNKMWYPQTAPATFNTKTGNVEKGFNLSMTAPQGKIYYTTDGTDPFVPENSVGNSITLISEDAAKRVLVPSSDIGTSWYSDIYFDDASWQEASGGVGYENGTSYTDFIKMDLGPEMFGKQASCYLRMKFHIDALNLIKYNSLKLKLLYDDGFVAYLNGVKISQSQSPTPLTWNAAAKGNHQATDWETIELSDYLDVLQGGSNLLAFHALNVGPSSSDFLISVQLEAGILSNEGNASENANEYTSPITLVQRPMLNQEC